MTIDLYPGVGKTETEIQRITELASLPNAAALPVFVGPRGILHITTRSEVESMDLERLVASYGPSADLERINHLLGRTSYTIAGYEDDARELYEIPEVLERATEEFEAEIVSYLVCERLGIGLGSAKYLAGYLDKQELPKFSLDAALLAAGKIEEMGRRPLRIKMASQ